MTRSKITWTICAAAIAGLATTGCSSDAETAQYDTTPTTTQQQKPTSGSSQMQQQPQQQQPQQQQPQQQGVLDDDGMFERGEEGPLEPSEEQLLTQFRGAEPIGTTRGEATFYADDFAGQRTASGDVYRPNEMTAASRRYPLGTVIRVVNPDNDQLAIVRINDRLSTSNPDGADIDLSRAAAERIGIIEEGRADVRIEVLELGD